MALIVQKYGGSSVRDVERMREVAKRVIEEYDSGNQVVVAVSAMGKTTDNLLAMVAEITNDPPPREVDMLLATGEQISIALLSMVIISMGRKAISFTGPQVGIQTDASHRKARIKGIKGTRLKNALKEGYIAVVAGFQGETDTEEITTLGRGGSDTTAVALAAALKADRCDIFTDVEGVYTADPRIVPNARLLEKITYDEMLELASLGAKVLHSRSVELAKNFNVPLRVLSSFSRHPGTMVVEEQANMEDMVVSGIACSKNDAKLTLIGVPDKPGVAAGIFGRLGESNISVDMIIQNLGADGVNDISFTVSKEDLARAKDLTAAICKELGARSIEVEDNIAKVSVVGIGMKSHSGVAGRIFRAMAKQGINIKMIATSEISISCLIDTDKAEAAVKAIHEEFGLGTDKIAVVHHR
ncbi:aspartate kinase [Candidatus Sumerlaeota bacterium]|nr:aspartate kinase [Candidatus Sumerlaeota bacterium]